MKALQAGKHVLLEKPSADTAEETREMFQLAKAKGLVLLEAFHYRHVCVARVQSFDAVLTLVSRRLKFPSDNASCQSYHRERGTRSYQTRRSHPEDSERFDA